ncbi:IclR family transcriptional regulator [Paraburkholderia phytofirmans]|uniref:IclR family transcriptional regulator n=1 Tax=Paraburkholderia phytofirmans TaxID=261302 RepID=UPI0038B83053
MLTPQKMIAPIPKPASAGNEQIEHVPAVVRALSVLELLSRQTEPISLARLTSELALPKSSVRAICNTLTSCGYVRRQQDGSYRLSPKIVSLAELFLAGTDVAREFNAIWSDSRSSPEETVLLSVLSGSDAVYLAVRNSIRPLGLAFRVGLKFPAWVSASGKAMLAYLPAEEARRIISEGLQSSKSSGGSRALNILLKELELTRQRGYSVDDQGIREGVYAFGAPVFDATGAAVAAVSVCVSTTSLEGKAAERHRDVALGVARELTERLGGQAVRMENRPRGSLHGA